MTTRLKVLEIALEIDNEHLLPKNDNLHAARLDLQILAPQNSKVTVATK